MLAAVQVDVIVDEMTGNAAIDERVVHDAA